MRALLAAVLLSAVTASAAAPGGRGPPYRLAATHPLEKLDHGLTLDAIAADGSAIASYALGPDQITILDLRTTDAVAVPNPANLAGFGAVRGERPPMTWSMDQRFLWSVQRQQMKPSGFAISGLRPVRIGRDGAIARLPALQSPAGPLDAVQWIGHAGLALAQFGTSGTYYRPEHADPAPELAMVDAARGRILARLPLADLPSFRARKDGLSARAGIVSASAVLLPDGRLRALIQMNGKLVRWTQGGTASELDHPAPRDRWTRAMLLPSGRTFLLTRELRPDGIQIAYRVASGHPPQPPPLPRTGPLLELRDFASGKLIWAREPGKVSLYRRTVR